MEDRIKKLVREWLVGEERDWLDRAIETLDKDAFKRISVNHYLEVEKNDLFSIDISKTIAFLEKLRKQGYTSISQKWCGAEEDYFIADKEEEETDDEYGCRVSKIVRKRINELMAEEEQATADRAEIKRLRGEIKKIQKRNKRR